jgi:hypothetical protein
VPAATLCVLQVLFIIRHARREVARRAVTTGPTNAWVARRLRDDKPSLLRTIRSA